MTGERYGILILPSANRVYAEASVGLLRAELEVLDEAALGGRVRDIEAETIGGVPYLTFGMDDLGPADVRFLANLSSIYALFRLEEGGGLRPVELFKLDRFDDDLITIQKYSGKTNEQFTKLLLNVTILSSDFAGQMLDRIIEVLDPLAGRGTTLNQALMYGYNAAGVETDGKDFDAYGAFIRTYLKRKRLKHSAETVPVRRERKIIARKFDVTLGLDKESYKAGDTRHLTVYGADTLRTAELFPQGVFDVVVADMPYGVQHGSRSREGGLSRNPLDLLAEALPGWATVLRPGGSIGISWNTHVAGREEAAEVFAKNGLQVLDYGPYERFRHRVDQSIVRDVLIARKA